MLFLAVLVLQFVAMLCHRAVALMQLIRKTSLRPRRAAAKEAASASERKSEMEKRRKLLGKRTHCIAPRDTDFQDIHQS
jgi:hypothetical protein